MAFIRRGRLIYLYDWGYDASRRRARPPSAFTLRARISWCYEKNGDILAAGTAIGCKKENFLFLKENYRVHSGSIVSGIGAWTYFNSELYAEQLLKYGPPSIQNLFSMFRNVMPKIIANSIVGVSPMTGPSASIMTLRARYANAATSCNTSIGGATSP